MMDATSTVRVFDIQRFSVHDGPGIRTTVFLKGCPLRCRWCQNPESMAPGPELLFYPDLCAGCGACAEACPRWDETVGPVARPEACSACGACAEVCPTGARRIAGREMSPDAVVEAGMRDVPFYGEQGGVTFGGGEPLLQWSGLSRIAQRLRSRGVHVAVDTSGFVSPAVVEAVSAAVDLVLVDLKLMTPEKHRAWTGRDNARILHAIRMWSAAMPGQVWVTTPVIPGVHDARELEHIAVFIAGLNPVPATRLIPYHRLGESKYRALGLNPPAFSGDVEDLMAAGREIYQDHGLQVLTHES